MNNLVKIPATVHRPIGHGRSRFHLIMKDFPQKGFREVLPVVSQHHFG